MNVKAEVFKKYLEEKKIEAFQIEEVKDDAPVSVEREEKKKSKKGKKGKKNKK